jgi:hypothetical protein
MILMRRYQPPRPRFIIASRGRTLAARFRSATNFRPRTAAALLRIAQHLDQRGCRAQETAVPTDRVSMKARQRHTPLFAPQHGKIQTGHWVEFVKRP